jgi:hypothetical protein
MFPDKYPGPQRLARVKNVTSLLKSKWNNINEILIPVLLIKAPYTTIITLNVLLNSSIHLQIKN